ncbi:hypothetical protein EJ06DRAFT_531477 [Trichodelitschia bisporula]|uniref:YCII-related domain-containing protein n=1 Tax=Trichodelitschia bisporula TaxID=703511 RepID=A0A6G1HTU4_9PEZI|nr:hypothetical protein EJ06DRAFT_531477 [Trichodelitschia bisporula]
MLPLRRLLTPRSLPSKVLLTAPRRSMASSESKKHEWLVIIPDKAGALDRRMKVRPSHLSAIKPLHESGFWTFGGATLSGLAEEGKTPPITGSVMLAHAASEEEVWAAIKRDIYVEEDVWDLEKVQVIPFKTAIRSALQG